MLFRSHLERRGGLVGNLTAIAAWAVIVAGSVWMSYRVRDYSLAHISHAAGGDVAILSPAVLSTSELNKAVEVAWEDSEVAGRLAAAGVGKGAKLLVYVVPGEWRLPDLPMEAIRTGGHYTPNEFDRNRLKVLFTQIRRASCRERV